MRRSLTPLPAALILILLAGAASRVAAQNEVPRQISLDQALEMAHVNSPQAIQARGQTRVNEAALRSAYAAFIPSLSVSMGANRQIPATGGVRRDENGQLVTIAPDPWSFSSGVSANVAIFEGGRRFYDISQARAGVDAAEANELTQEFNVALNVKQEYFNVLAAQEALVASRSQLDQAEQQYRAAIARVRAGSGTKSDSLRSQIEVSDARIAVLEVLNALEASNAALTRAIGSDEPVTALDSLPPEPEMTFTDEELLMMAENGPAVIEAEASLRSARALRSASKSAYFPSVNAGWSYGGSDTEPPGFENPRGALRFSLSFPIFNQLNREEQVIRSGVAEVNAEAQLRDSRLAAREDLTRFLGTWRTAGQRVESALQSVAAAEEDLRVQQQRYTLGASTLLDLLASQSTLEDARRNLIRSRYDQRVARAQIEALVGREL